MTEESNLPVSANQEQALETLALVESWIKERIISFDRRRKFYRARAYRFTLLTAGLSGATTVLISVSRIYNSTTLSVVALVTSAFMTFLSAWEGFYSYRQRWIQNNDTLMKLYALDSDIQYQRSRSGNQLTIEEIDQFYNQYQVILQQANEKWREDRGKNN